jgi:hypothetical protein
MAASHFLSDVETMLNLVLPCSCCSITDLHSPPAEDGLLPGIDLALRDDLANSIHNFCQFRNLNQAQTEAVQSTALALLFDEAHRVRLIQGPPGCEYFP